jgi:hypothetical protein
MVKTPKQKALDALRAYEPCILKFGLTFGNGYDAIAALENEVEGQSALDRFKECGGDGEPDPLERLRFFCSLAMNAQDWLDSEQFFDDLNKT